MLTWAPWTISLPRRIPRSRRITITCFGSIPTLPNECIATKIRVADLRTRNGSAELVRTLRRSKLSTRVVTEPDAVGHSLDPEAGAAVRSESLVPANDLVPGRATVRA